MTRCLIFEDVHLLRLKMYIPRGARAWEDNVHVLLLFLNLRMRTYMYTFTPARLKMYMPQGLHVRTCA